MYISRDVSSGEDGCGRGRGRGQVEDEQEVELEEEGVHRCRHRSLPMDGQLICRPFRKPHSMRTPEYRRNLISVTQP